jgi:hypothetical protein
MPNDPLTFSVGSLEARHVPEPDETYDPAAYDRADHVTGFIDIGVTVDGVFVILTRRKAPGLVADIALKKAEDAQTAQAAPAPAEPAPPAPVAPSQ